MGMPRGIAIMACGGGIAEDAAGGMPAPYGIAP